LAKTARITTHLAALTEPFTAERLTALAQHSGVLLSDESINAAVTQVMDEIGLELTREYPKPLTDDVVQAFDVVITMGCGDACPVYPGKRYVDWEQPALCRTADIASAGAPSATARFHVEDTANDDRTCPRKFAVSTEQGRWLTRGVVGLAPPASSPTLAMRSPPRCCPACSPAPSVPRPRC